MEEHKDIREQEIEKPVLDGLCILAKIIAREIENENLQAKKQSFINQIKEEENSEK